jgi:hypothetical protein
LISWLDFLQDNLFICFGHCACNFLDLTVRQSPQGLSCDIFDKCSQPEYAGIEMIRMPHVHSNISMTAMQSWGLSIVNFTDS